MSEPHATAATKGAKTTSTSGVAITGMGIITSIGDSVSANLQSLVERRSGIARLRHIDSTLKDKIFVAEVAEDNDELFAYLGIDPSVGISRASLLGIHAARQAVEDAGIDDIGAARTGLISSTTVGGMDKTEQYFYDYLESDTHHRFIDAHPAGMSTHAVADDLGISKSLVTTLSTACSSGANAIMLGARLLKSGILDRVIVGGTDCLSKFTMNGFNSLMILSDEPNTPFDAARKGLNLGEGAAYLVLESGEQVKKTGKRVLGYVKGYANANDAHHQTASSEYGDGATSAMEKALRMCGLSAEDIDHINAHGTATMNNDLSEGRAIERVFGKDVPDFSSTKAYTGHTLASAGAVEAVYSILAIRHGSIFPTLHFSEPMPEIDLRPQTELVKRDLGTVMSNSFGFGGNCSSVIFSKTA